MHEEGKESYRCFVFILLRQTTEVQQLQYNVFSNSSLQHNHFHKALKALSCLNIDTKEGAVRPLINLCIKVEVKGGGKKVE